MGPILGLAMRLCRIPSTGAVINSIKDETSSSKMCFTPICCGNEPSRDVDCMFNDVSLEPYQGGRPKNFTERVLREEGFITHSCICMQGADIFLPIYYASILPILPVAAQLPSPH
jgi:hypothetical protein